MAEAMNINFRLQRFNLSLAAKQWHSQQKQRILCLHGWLDNANSFDLLAPHFSQQDVIALDFPGHGYSDHLPKAGSYSILGIVEHMIAFIDEQNWSNLTIIGHSLGACLASLIAACIPDRMKHLVLIEGIGPLPLTKTASQQFCHYLNIAKRYTKKTLPTYASIEAAASVRSQRSNVNYEMAYKLATRGTRKLPNGDYTWRTDPRLLTPSAYALTENQVLDFLSNISCPTLFIQGKSGFFVDSKILSPRLSCIQKLTHYTLDGGHHLHLEYPDETAALIKSYLEQTIT